MPRFSIHRFSRNPDLVENFAAPNHFYSIKLQYSRNFNLVDSFFSDFLEKMLLLLDFFGKNVALGGFFCCSPYYLHEEMLLWDSSPHRKVVVQNLCSSFSVSYQLIGDKWTHKWNSFLWAIQLLPLWQKVCRKAHCKSIIMSEKRTRISLAQKLDIIEASKKCFYEPASIIVTPGKRIRK